MKNQKGFTLIELMVGLVVGLIVLSAVIYAFISTLRSSADIVNSVRLNREMANISDILVGELRRSGYWPVTSATNSPFGATPDIAILPTDGVADTCVLYSYYNDSVTPEVQVYRGIAVDSGVIYYSDVVSTALSSATSCDPVGESWPELSNSKFLQVNSLSLNLTCFDVLTGTSLAYASCRTAGTSTLSRSISISLEAAVVSDPEWSSGIDEVVKLQNDLSN